MTLIGHTANIRAIVVLDELRICSCSDDKTIKIWDTSTGLCERTLEGHTGYIRDIILIYEGKLCSVSDDGSAKIWSIDRGECEATILTDSGGLLKSFKLNDKLALLGKNGKVYVVC